MVLIELWKCWLNEDDSEKILVLYVPLYSVPELFENSSFLGFDKLGCKTGSFIGIRSAGITVSTIYSIL